MVHRAAALEKPAPEESARRGRGFSRRLGPSPTPPECRPALLSQSTRPRGGPNTGDIESAAYLGTYDPANLCLNYLGDSGISGLGTTVGSASYSFTVPAGANLSWL